LVTPAQKVGVGEYLHNLIRELQILDRENKYFIFTVKETEHFFSVKTKNFREIRVNFSHNGKLPSSMARTVWLHTGFLTQCRRLGIDLIHIPNTQLILWKRPSTIVSIMDLREWRMGHSNIIRTLYRRFANLTQARLSVSVLTISESSKRDIHRFLGVSEEKVNITYLAASDRFYNSPKPEEAKALILNKYGIQGEYILSVASFMKHKNIERLLKAVDYVKQCTDFSLKLVLVGKSGDRHSGIHKTVSKLGLKDDIIFTGYVPDEHLPHFFTAAKMFVFPSLWEGFGLPVLEAMACGCPVICSNIASLPEVAGDAALLVNPYQIAEIADAIIKITKEPETEQRMKHDGPAQAAKFNWCRTAKQTLEIYMKAVSLVSTSCIEKED
jgi:glycosyltransferase involved in cell wall biosynthesis